MKMALVAHDNMKDDILDWAVFNRDRLARYELIGTGTTGRLVADATGLPVELLASGPLGGDQQVGAKISEQEIDILVFFWDPLEPMPHDPDVKALLRIAVVWNIPFACNRASADYLIASRLIGEAYERRLPDHAEYIARTIPALEKP